MQILMTAASLPEIFPEHTAFPQMDMLCTGVGAAHSAYHLTQAICSKQYDLVMQIGICGSFNLQKHPLGKVVFVQNDRFADLGAWELDRFADLEEMGFLPIEESAYKKGWLVNPYPLHEGLGIPSVDSITVNSIQDNPARNQHFLEKYGADIETMEGAALHYVCLQENIPFVQLRGISNRVGERDKLQWKLNEAIENLHQQTDKFLQNILKDYQ